MASLLHISVSTCILFSMLMLGLYTFRISVKRKWPLTVVLSLLTSCMAELITLGMGTKSLTPMLVIVLEAMGIHYCFRLRKLHALMIMLLGAVGYTMYLAIVLFVVSLTTNVPMYIYFDGLDSLYRPLKIWAAMIAYFTALVLNRNRLGFTFRLERGSESMRRRRNQVLLPVFVTAFILFSSAYYGVSMHLTSIFYWAAGFCVVLAWMIYLLYRKEMDEL